MLALQLPTVEPLLSKQMSNIGLGYPQGVTEETPATKPVKKTPAKDANVIKRDGVYGIVHHTCVFLPHCELCSKPDQPRYHTAQKCSKRGKAATTAVNQKADAKAKDKDKGKKEAKEPTC